jgi:hypothetical protein
VSAFGGKVDIAYDQSGHTALGLTEPPSLIAAADEVIE